MAGVAVFPKWHKLEPLPEIPVTCRLSVADSIPEDSGKSAR